MQPYFLNWLMNMLKGLELWSFAYLLILCFPTYLERLTLTKKELISTYLFNLQKTYFMSPFTVFTVYLHCVYGIIIDFIISKNHRWVIPDLLFILCKHKISFSIFLNVTSTLSSRSLSCNCHYTEFSLSSLFSS